MPVSRRIISLGLVLVLLGSTQSLLMLQLWFELDRAYVASEVCETLLPAEMSDEPTCNSVCHQAQQMIEAHLQEEKERQAEGTWINLALLLFVLPSQEAAPGPPLFVARYAVAPLLPSPPGHAVGVFRPPRLA